MFNDVEARFRALCRTLGPPSEGGFLSLRVVEEESERLWMRQGVLQPIAQRVDRGAMVTALEEGGLGYASTPDLSEEGLAAAIERARAWARRTGPIFAFDAGALSMPHPVGEHRSPVRSPWASLSLADKIDLLKEASERLKRSDKIVDWSAELWRTRATTLYLTSGGGRTLQILELMVPHLSATANEGTETQTRSSRHGASQQGGLEILERTGFWDMAERFGEEALELLAAPNCPTGTMDLILDPEQMMLQIHESIGHPLELDRILGDERNYAGTSFVDLDMFGTYRYGSELLNVSFDPTIEEQFASYAYDDDGSRAKKRLLIEGGILKEPLGGLVSRTRAGLPEPDSGIANARATTWNRPAMDRMANLNVEPGDSSFEELVAGVERGVLMKTNRSWSIDDSRNKFQFGCEHGRLIEDGELKGVVKNPGYRGISATFWRSLSGVGDRSTFEVLGSPYCGKGEPNQLIRVGHASPACRFSGVEVFGGG